mmetsp:Transcript_4563/g.6044  ORF Transcript_4563/g.6044 Transcript_4563/m.6044 type:complete len:104 (-) Transcript_4563:2111-2422(-)
MKSNMDAEKAAIYAEKGSSTGVLDPTISIKKEKIVNSLDNAFSGFNNELSQVEKDDIEIHKTQLAIQKEREMNSAEAGIDEEVNKSEKTKEIEDLRDKLKSSI